MWCSRFYLILSFRFYPVLVQYSAVCIADHQIVVWCPSFPQSSVCVMTRLQTYPTLKLRRFTNDTFPFRVWIKTHLNDWQWGWTTMCYLCDILDIYPRQQIASWMLANATTPHLCVPSTTNPVPVDSSISFTFWSYPLYLHTCHVYMS